MSDEQLPARPADISDRLGQAILQTASDAILFSDREGIIRFWGPGAERIFGFSAGEAIGRNLDIIIPENQRDRHWQGYERVMRTGETRYGSGDLLRVPALTKDGRRISVEFTIVIVRGDDGGIAGMGAVLRDVTVRFEEMKSLKRKVADLMRSAQGD